MITVVCYRINDDEAQVSVLISTAGDTKRGTDDRYERFVIDVAGARGARDVIAEVGRQLVARYEG